MDEIKTIRKEIDKIDDKLIALFVKRLQLVKKIGEIKFKNNVPVLVAIREREIIRKKIKQSEKMGLNPKFIRRIWRTIFKEAYLIEKK